MDDYLLPCLNKKMFGVECFGCGTQRSFLLLIKGDFIGAFQMFPAIYTLIILFACIGLHFIDKSRNYHKAIVSMAIINAAVMVFSYFYKVTHY